MEARQFEALLRKYGNPIQRIGIPEHVRHDVMLLIEHANAQHRLVSRLRAEVLGAMQTMLALTRAVGGVVEIPFALIDRLHAQDSLEISDIRSADGGVFKRFRYKAFDATKAPLDSEMPPDTQVH